MNGLRLFIDNSNLFIEAQRTARKSFYYDDQMIPRLRISYGNLLDVIKGERELSEAILVGSRPPQNDDLWKKLEALNIEPKIFDRSSHTGKEKQVDTQLVTEIVKTIYKNKTPGTIALVAGDSDYIPALKECLQEKWHVEIYFWEQASKELKNMHGLNFHNLDEDFENITFLESGKD